MKTIWGKLVGMGLGLLASGLSAQPVITSQPTSQIVLSGNNVNFDVAATGTAPLSYMWQRNGTNINLITTVAGGGTNNPGDGGAATNAGLNAPYGLGFDASGNLYVGDSYNNRIRKVDANGIITTVAGNGSLGYAGDGGVATNAALHYPYNIVFDIAGNLYFPEANRCVRKVDTNAIITTVAGNGIYGFSGDGGLATNASFSSASRVAFDNAGNLYISDDIDNRIRRVDTNGVITTIAGNGLFFFSGDGGQATNATLYSPEGIYVDRIGNLYIADSTHNRIRKVDTNGVITTVAGNGTRGYSGDGGLATLAKLSYPYSVVIDVSGNMFIADQYDSSIRKVDTNGFITTVAGIGSSLGLGGFSGDGGEATLAYLHGPTDINLDSDGNLFIADNYNNRIREVGLTTGLRISSVVLPSITTNYATNYKVVITNPSGSVTSSVINLSVVYSVPPLTVTVTNGTPATFSVAAYGVGAFGYQWFFNTNTAINGGTNASLGIMNTAYGDTGKYFCVVSNISGTVTSSIATLTVRSLPNITTQPTNQNILVGNNLFLSVGVSGTLPFNYKWYFNTNTAITGGTNSILNITNVILSQSGNYNCVITNLYGSATSAAAKLTVFLPPQNFTAYSNTNRQQLTFQLIGTPSFPYVLQSSSNLTPPISWQSILTNYTDTNGNWSLIITNLSAASNIFYRAAGQ